MRGPRATPTRWAGFGPRLAARRFIAGGRRAGGRTAVCAAALHRRHTTSRRRAGPGLADAGAGRRIRPERKGTFILSFIWARSAARARTNKASLSLSACCCCCLRQTLWRAARERIRGDCNGIGYSARAARCLPGAGWLRSPPVGCFICSKHRRAVHKNLPFCLTRIAAAAAAAAGRGETAWRRRRRRQEERTVGAFCPFCAISYAAPSAAAPASLVARRNARSGGSGADAVGCGRMCAQFAPQQQPSPVLHLTTTTTTRLQWKWELLHCVCARAAFAV